MSSSQNARAGTIAVEGVKESIRELRAIDKKLAAQAIKDMKAPAQGTASRLKATAPGQPLSHMQAGPVKVSVRYGGRGILNAVNARGTVSPLVKIVLLGPGWTASSDMAQNGGSTMVPNLTRKYGRGASRWAWPTVEADRARLQSAIAAAAESVVRQVSNQMSYRG